MTPTEPTCFPVEPVCDCGHNADEHSIKGPCSQCNDPPCRFLHIRFWRETMRLTRRTDVAGPAGYYWTGHAPPGSPAWVFSLLAPADREEIKSVCWRKAMFDSDGNIDCPGKRDRRRHGMDCGEEYICEMLAAFILFPPGHSPDASDTELARGYQMLPAHIRFRRLIEQGLLKKSANAGFP